MYSAKIKALNDEYIELIEFCRLNNQVSFEMYINDTYKKSLLLSAASYFEVAITKAIHDFVDRKSRQNTEIVAFVDNKAMKRQYHTFFNWDGNNANQFLDYLETHSSIKPENKFKQKSLARLKLHF